MARLTFAATAATAVAAGFAASRQAAAFLAPVAAPAAPELRFAAPASVAEAAPGAGQGWAGASAIATVAIGAHVGLALRGARGSTTRRAEAEGKEVAKKVEKKEAVTKYVETATDAKLFEQVYFDYTVEYLKGPMYLAENKYQGFGVGYVGRPMFMDKKQTSNVVGNLQSFSSNELAFLAFLFFGIGLYGNLMWNVYDPQWDLPAKGYDFNGSYIVESLCLPISFFFHIACYIQRKNGK